MAKRRNALLVLISTLALTLAACGEDEPDETAADDSTDAEEPAGEDEESAGEDEESGGEDAAAALEGELITVVTGTSPGGGYDTYARMVAPFLAEEFGAESTVENETGAGGLLMLNNLWTSDPDGTRIAIMNGSGTVGSVLAGAEGIEFDFQDFSFLGRIASEPRLLAARADLPYETGEDLIGVTDEFRFAATGPGGSTFNDGALSIELFNLENGDVVSGFDGSSESIVSVVAGETDGIVSTADTILPHVESGDLRALAVLADERIEELPDVPTLLELSFDDEQMAIAEAMVAITQAGRVFGAPPDMPEDLLAELRTAFENVANSEEFLAEAENQERPVSYASGEETLETIRTALEAPDRVGEILAEAMGG